MLADAGTDLRATRRPLANAYSPSDDEDVDEVSTDVFAPIASAPDANTKNSSINTRASKGFMKPGGVDAPSASAKRPAERPAEVKGKTKKKRMGTPAVTADAW
jgi:hypothetical protein